MESLLQFLESLVIRVTSTRRPAPPVVRALPSSALGRTVDDDIPVLLTAKDLAKHCYILGSTGCGKTSLILKLIAQDLAAGHSVAVVDLRGDLVAGALSLCASSNIDPRRVHLIDLRSRGGAGFNPLIGSGEPYIRALHFLDVVSAESDSWGVQLEETLRSALLLLAEAGQPVVHLERLFYDDAFRTTCLRTITDEGVVSFWARYDALSLEKRQTWALPVLNKVTPLLAVPVLRELLGSPNPLDLGACLGESGSVLLVSLAVDELHRSSRMLGSLVVSAISREMMARVHVPERDRNPVRLYVDEFENMASDAFEGLIAEGRRFGLTLVLSHQTLSQLPPRLRSVVRNNVGVQILFQCGFEDARQLARELPEGIETANLRALEVGEAYVLDRSGRTLHAKFSPPPKPLPTEDIELFRQTLTVKVPVDGESKVAVQATTTQKPDLEDLL